MNNNNNQNELYKIELSFFIKSKDLNSATHICNTILGVFKMTPIVGSAKIHKLHVDKKDSEDDDD